MGYVVKIPEHFFLLLFGVNLRIDIRLAVWLRLGLKSYFNKIFFVEIGGVLDFVDMVVSDKPLAGNNR